MASARDKPPGPGPAKAEPLRVFISYSRIDTSFADEIVAGLGYDGAFEVSIDRQAIYEAEDWKARIGSLIEGADSIVFILSNKSLTSEICLWEVKEAVRLSKRIIPIQAAVLNGVTAPGLIAALNYVRFDPQDDGRPRSFMGGLSGLRRALITDLAWLREHTRLHIRAREWLAAGRAENRLLYGSDIAAAKDWQNRWPKDAPPPTEQHRDFIAASEQAEALRLSVERARADALQKAVNRLRVAFVVVFGLAILAVTFGGLAGWLQKKAAEERDAALRAQSRHLSDVARQSMRDGDNVTAMLLALAGLPDARLATPLSRFAPNPSDRPYVPETDGSLYEGYLASRELALLKGHEGPIFGIAVSADGKRIVTGSGETARIWDAATGDPVEEFKGPGASVLSVAISPDGTRVVTGSDDKMMRIWDAATGAVTGELQGHDGLVSSVAVSRDGTRIVSGSGDNTAWVWDAATRRKIVELKGHVLPVTSVAISADGARIVTGSFDAKARIWDAATGAPIKEFSGHGDTVSSVAISPDGKAIATASDDKTVRVWDAATADTLLVLKGHAAGISGIAFSPDGARIVTGSADNSARIWNIAGNGDTIVLGGHAGAVSVAISSDGTRLVTGSEDKIARLWDARSGQLLRPFEGHSKAVLGVAINADGTRIATASEDARLWDTAGGEPKVLSEHRGQVLSVAFSANGAQMVTGGEDGTARLRDATTGNEIAMLDPHPGRVTSVAFGPAGDKVMTGAGTAPRVWHVNVPGRAPDRLISPGGPVLSLAVSADGARLVSGARDATARVFDLATLKEIAVLRGHEGAVSAVAINSDGTRAVTGSSDSTVRLWDVATQTQIATIAKYPEPVTGIAVSSDGARIVAGTSDGTARLSRFFASPQSLVDRVKDAIPRCLTPPQLKDFHLPPEPPRWCITGGNLEHETDPARWSPKWPYHSGKFRDWLIARDKGDKAPLPEP